MKTRAVAGSAPKPADPQPSAPVTPILAYRPYLDGLRAIAVYLVVMFHASAEDLPGGFVGVDVFFVLSGYLVTQVLLRDIAGYGAIRFDRFYARRFRRLFPAAFVALVSTAVVYAAVASPPEVLAAVRSFQAAFLYSANWYFVAQSSSYFGVDAATNPVLHFWSLAVEEQFYLLWPLGLAGLFALTGEYAHRRLAAVRIVVAALALASLARALALRAAEPGWAYYGTDARAYQLLAGAVVALTPTLVASAGRSRRSMQATAAVAVAGLLATATPLADIDAIARGVVATLTTCVLIVALEAADDGVIRRMLSSDFMVYLGKISYGTYLWHWPVLLVAEKTWQLSSPSRVTVAVVFASALASLSAALLEQPIRDSRLLDRHSRAVVMSGLAASVLAALVLIPAVMAPAVGAGPSLANRAVVESAATPPDLDWRNAKWANEFFRNCQNQPVEACTLVKGSGRRLLLIGDSHAQSWLPTFTEIARRENLTLSVSVKGACPWQRDLFRPETTYAGMAVRPEECKKYKDDLYERVIPGLRPDVIVLAQFPYGDSDQSVPFVGADFGPLSGDATAHQLAIEKATASSLAVLRAGGSEVLIIEPIPVVSWRGIDPLHCIASAEGKGLEACRYVASTEPSPVEEIYRAFARRDPKVRSADFDRLVCPYLPICDPVVNGQIVKWDREHLTVKFAASLADPVDAYLKGLALIPAAPTPAPAAASAH